MKQFIALLFLVAYGFTSIGAPVAVHQCGYKQHRLAQHTATGCGHTIATAMDCCISNQQSCTVKSDENTTELTIYKDFIPHYPLLSSSFAGEQEKFFFPVSSLAANSDAPQNVYKIRLHLYKRVLLI